MKERGLICNTFSVQGILADRKTQTRRLDGLKEVNKNPDGWICSGPNDAGDHLFVAKDWQEQGGSITDHTIIIKARYKVGDRLYVRETWAKSSEQKVSLARTIVYRADKDKMFLDVGRNWRLAEHQIFWKPSIHMPKVVARIWLEITNIRVERVQSIITKDILAEGIVDQRCGADGLMCDFAILWNTLNEKRGYGWDKNPWVWVIEFKRAGQKGE